MKFNERVEEILNEILDTKYDVKKVKTSDKRKYLKYKAKMGKMTLTFEGTYQRTYKGSNKKFEDKPIYRMRFSHAEETKKAGKVGQFVSWLFGDELDIKVKYKDFAEYESFTKPSMIQIFGAFKSTIDQFFKDYPTAILYIKINDIGSNDSLRKVVQKITKKFGSDYNIEFVNDTVEIWKS